MSCLSCFFGAKEAASSSDSRETDIDDGFKRMTTGFSQGEGLKVDRRVSMSGRLSSKQHSKVIESLEALHEAGMPVPLNVSCCEPGALVKDVHELRWVGQGSQGVVYEGIWQGAVVAVKWSIAEQLDTGACELLFSRLLGHPNVVQTYDAKVAVLNSQIFEHDTSSTSGNSALQSSVSSRSNDRASPIGNGTIAENPDMLDARSGDSYKSEEGFGNPFGRHSSFNDVRDMLRLIGAKPGQCITQMIMEYCDQGSLLTAISRGIFLPTSRFGPKVALRALFRTSREISQGMVHLHQANIVHGDLKPANVLLMNSRKDRRGFIAKISDFGLAQYCPASHGVVENAPWGTLVFMAPERFCSNRLEPASDVWSLGVLMWQMYTARLPYEGTTQAKLLQGISNGNLHLTWPPGSPPSLVNSVGWCMARQPHQRPTFETLIHHLATLESDVRMEGFRLSNSVEMQRQSDEVKTLKKSLSSKNAPCGQLSPTDSPTASGPRPSAWSANPLITRPSHAQGPAAPASPVPGQTTPLTRNSETTPTTTIATPCSRTPTSPTASRPVQGGLWGTAKNSESSGVSSNITGPRNATRNSSTGPTAIWTAAAISEGSGICSKQSTQTSLDTSCTPGISDASALLRFGSAPEQEAASPRPWTAHQVPEPGSWSCASAAATTSPDAAPTTGAPALVTLGWGAYAQAKRSQVMSRFAQGLRFASPDEGESDIR